MNAVLDINGDGYLDVISGGNALSSPDKIPLEIFVGGKDGKFTLGGSNIFEGSLPSRIGYHRSVVADFNGDGRDDVFFGTYGYDGEGNTQAGEKQLLLLSGNNKLHVAPTSYYPQDTSTTHALTAGDIDGDGDIDIWVGVNGGNGTERSPYFLINDGTGRFTKDLTRVPEFINRPWESQLGTSALLADLNNDGAKDLWLGPTSYDPRVLNTILKNDGTGHFSVAATADSHVQPSYYAIFTIAIDMDGDGDLDVLQAEGDFPGPGHAPSRNLSAYTNKGNFNFADETSQRVFGFGPTTGIDSHGINDIQAVDFNGDGAQDLLIEYNYDDYRILLNNGDGVFFLPTDGLVPNRGGQVVAGDFTKDGHPDLVGLIGGPPELWLWTWAHQPTYRLIGTSGSNALFGDARGNKMDGGAGHDTIRSGAGRDSVVGGTGKDKLDGGSGTDTLVGGDGNDVLDGGTGSRDVADYSGKTVSIDLKLNAANFAEVKVDAIIEDKVRNIEFVVGGTKGDVITGDQKANLLDGRGGGDKLSGDQGADTLIGGKGSDVLTGGSSADQFRFDTALGNDVDRISDFAHGEDKIALDDTIFVALGGSVTSDEFGAKASGHIAADKQHIIYDKSNGTLWYDADDNGSGAAIQFATLSNKPQNLTYADFVIV